MRDSDTGEDPASNGNPSASDEHTRGWRPWERRLSWRGRLARASGAVLVLAALAGILIGSGGVALPWADGAGNSPPTPVPTWNTITLAGQVTALPGGGWQQVRVPSQVGRVVSFTPSPVDAREAFLCGRDSSAVDAIWATYDGGATWARASFPALSGITDCNIASDVTLPHTFIASLVDSNRCEAPTLALTTDDGHTWTTLTNLPPALSLKQCWAGVSVSGRALYLDYVDMVYYDNGTHGTTPTPLYYSADLGRTWALTSLGKVPCWGCLAADPGGMVSISPPTFSSKTSTLEPPTLLTSDDGGRTWATAGMIYALYPDWLFAAPGASLATLLSRDNLLYGLSDVQIPNLLYRTRIAARQANGSWALLPPLPVPGTSPTRMGIAQVLAETPSGQLLALGTAPHEPLPDASADLSILPEDHAQWLWLWNPVRQQWLTLGPPLASAWTSGALGWQGTLVPTIPTGASGATTTLWLAHWSDPDTAGVDGLSIYRETLPEALP